MELLSRIVETKLQNEYISDSIGNYAELMGIKFNVPLENQPFQHAFRMAKYI
jgi:hypothetical protein